MSTYEKIMLSTRDQLVAAAVELLDRGGPKAVTLRAVAERVGISHNAPYKHFASKEALLATLAARELLDLDAALEGEALEALIARYIGWALRFPNRFRLAFGAWENESADLGAAAGRAQARLAAAVAEAQGRGRVREGDPGQIGALIQATVHGALEMELNGHLSPEGKHGMNAIQLAGRLLDILGPVKG